MRIFAVLLLLSMTAHAQVSGRSAALPVDTLAKVGSAVINATDFLERFELMPWPRKDVPSKNESVKLEFLRSMVAEKLLAVEAAAMNIGNDSESVTLQRNLERIFVRDEYYKKQVLPKITVTEAEMKEGMKRFPYELEVEVLAIVSKGDGTILKKRLSQNKNKTSVFDQFRDSLYVPVDTLQIKFGSVAKEIEDAVFAIGKDSLSQPIVTDFGMVMFRLLKWEMEPQNARFSHTDRMHKVESIIKLRKEEIIAKKAFADVTSPQRAEADPAIFIRLADSVIAMLRSDSVSYGSNGSFKFPSSAVDQLSKKFAGEHGTTFITIASGNMSLHDVLTGLSNNNILFPSLVPEHIRIVLNNNIKTVIQNELLSREGLRQNLNQSSKVRHDLSVWMDSRKNWLLSRRIIDAVTVSDEEIEQDFLQHAVLYGAEVRVSLKALLADSVTAAMQLRKRLANGESFEQIGSSYQKRQDPFFNGMPTPLKNIKELGTLGQFAAIAAPKEIVGPKSIDRGNVIFTVVNKVVVDDSVRSFFSEKRSEISRKLLSEKQQSALNKYIGTLAKKYNVVMDEEALKRVKTTTTNMVTWRNIGFGGRVVAVPQMFRQAEWVDEWKNQNQVNQ
jgi:hypothetical protein